ncbi:protein angel homolog 2 isoform X2 [Hippocampus comes]|uniref:Angel homolog 2 (Drosophila) n=1 Tax=Hippocampus comes TaxID=109280 RepID=A0A3Q2Y9R5_HIPCM|nr:PREDICTED: protein angel homolog 2 isoform X2 [Hippocampus comes]
MFLGLLSGIGSGLLPQHLSVCRLALVCLTSPRWVSTYPALMMDHEPPSKRSRSAEEKRSVKDRDANRGGGGGPGLRGVSRPRDTSRPGKVLSEDFKSKHVARTMRDMSERKDAGKHTMSQSRGSKSDLRCVDEMLGTSSRDAVGEPPPPGTESPDLQAPMRGWESLLPRWWEGSPACATAMAPHRGGRALDLSVMSYNILSQELLRANGYLYTHCPPAALRWSHRLRNLLAELRHYDADVLCLQEVQEDHFENQIRPALHAQGYECVYKKRTGKKPDGCVVAFKTSRLCLLSSNPVEFFRPGDALLDRDNVGLVVLLRPAGAGVDDGDVLCVANTHLLYNPRRGDVKLAQLAILLAEIGRLARLPNGAAHPVLLCGDFNSTPWSPLVTFLLNGRLDYRHLPIGTVSGQEYGSRGQRLLESPIWSPALGINQRCQYESTCASVTPSHSCGAAAVEREISELTVQEVAQQAAAQQGFAQPTVADKALNSWRLEHGVPLRSCYTPCLPPDGRAAITTCHSRCAMMVDYILYTPCESLPGERGLQLLDRLLLVGQPELEEVNGLPNVRHSSDHLPLLAHFRWMVGERS